MGMTMAQKILARNSGRKEVSVGEFVTAKIDQICLHDPVLEIGEGMERAGIEGGVRRVWDVDRVVCLIDHRAPPANEDVVVAERHIEIRKLAKRLGLRHFFDVKVGIGHQVLVEKGFALPGSIVLVPDSHATIYGAMNAAGTGVGETEMAWVVHYGELYSKVPPTIKIEVSGEMSDGVTAKDIFLKVSGTYGTDVAQYKSIEWVGTAIDSLSISDRLCVANQSVELGAKFGLFKADEKTLSYVEPRAVRSFSPVAPDPDAEYEATYEIDASKLEPLVAQPHSMEVVNPVDHYRNVAIDQAVIGGCANGRLEDIAWAARILTGRKVNPNVRFLISPATWEVFMAAMRAGYLETLIDAGALIIHPHCGICTGLAGVLGAGEVCITATSRNFKGRMGSPNAFIYLASTATVAASAVAGHIADPREVL